MQLYFILLFKKKLRINCRKKIKGSRKYGSENFKNGSQKYVCIKVYQLRKKIHYIFYKKNNLNNDCIKHSYLLQLLIMQKQIGLYQNSFQLRNTFSLK